MAPARGRRFVVALVAAALAAATLAACKDDPAVTDAAIDTGAVDTAVVDTAIFDTPALDCGLIASQLRDRLAVTSRACTTVADCSTVGGPVDVFGFYTCNCGISYAPSCAGAPVNTAAWEGDPAAAALVEEWRTRCVPLGCNAPGVSGTYDCGPGAIGCVDNLCTTSIHDCFSPDAGT